MNFFQQRRWGIAVSTMAVALFVLIPAAFAHAATLTLSSRSANVTAGDIVSVTITVNSNDQSINTAEGSLEFPTDVLQALSLDKSSSIFTIWVQDPTFSNSTGEVDFSGGLPTPGYQGNGGKVLTVTFIAKKAGVATISLANADVRANDGMGTDVLTSSNALQLTVTNPALAATVTAPSASASAAPASPSAASSDTTPPTITAPTFTFHAATGMLTVSAKVKDTGSGIADYTVSIDNGPPTLISPADFDSDSFQFPVHTSGSHSALLTVTDNAGNKATVSGTFMVPSIAPPTLNALPSSMNSGAQLSVQGMAQQNNAKVRIYISKDGGTPQMFPETPDASGSFILLGPIVQKGTYEVWAVGVSSGGVPSALSPKMPVSVSDVTVLSIGPLHLSLDEILLLFLLISLVSLLIGAFGWYKVYTYHRGRKHAIAKIQKDVHRALGVFKDDMAEHLEALDEAGTARTLTAAESKLREDMKSDLSDLEKYIDGEVK